MSKTILVILIIAILIVLALGAFYLVGLLAGSNGQNNSKNSDVFEIQGMKVEILKQGSGEAVKVGDSVTVHYVGTLDNGQKFDSSIDRNAPFTFIIGGQVIKGWNLGVEGMKVGEQRRLTIPPELAYGPAAFSIIPANATLTFEVQLLRINK